MIEILNMTDLCQRGQEGPGQEIHDDLALLKQRREKRAKTISDEKNVCKGQ